MANVTITQGTQTSVRTSTIAGNEYQHIVLNQGNTADSPFTGTLAAVTNLAGGTITSIVAGTQNTLGTIGVINNGTISTYGTHINTWATVVSTGTLTLGTIKPAVAGSQIFVTDITISVGSASNVVVASGGTSTPIYGSLFFNQNGGVSASFRTPIFTASGSALVYKQSAAVSEMTISAQGYVK